MRFLATTLRDLIGLGGLAAILYGLYLSLGLPIVFYTGGVFALSFAVLMGLQDARTESRVGDRAEARLLDRTGVY